eukprot:9504074-Pyramimonas_sp.AAC.2
MAPMTENKNMPQPGAGLGMLMELPAIQQLRSQIEAAKASNPVIRTVTSGFGVHIATLLS